MNIYPTNDRTIAKRLVVTEAKIGLVLIFETKTGSHKYTKPQKIHPRGKLSSKKNAEIIKNDFFHHPHLSMTIITCPSKM